MEDHKKELRNINRQLCERKFIDTGYLDGLLARRALILALNRPRLSFESSQSSVEL